MPDNISTYALSEEALEFYYSTQAQYDAQLLIPDAIKDSAIYVTTDTQRIYKGQTLIGANNVKTVDSVPEPSLAVPNVIYVTETAEHGVTLSMLSKDGSQMNTLINTSELVTWTDQVKLSSEITLSLAGQSLGGIEDGYTFENGTNLTTILQKLMRKEEPASITTQPSLSLSGTGTASAEVGTTVTPEINASFNAGTYKYGPATGVTVTSYTLTQKLGSAQATTLLDGVSAIEKWTAPGPITIPDGNITFSGTVQHSEGVPAHSSFGTPNDSVKITAGSKNATKVYTGYRKMFYGSSADNGGADDPITSEEIRALSGSKQASASGSTGLTVTAGHYRLIFAYPASLKDITKISDPNGFDATAAFTKVNVDVEGANGYTAQSYKVYRLDSLTPLTAGTYTFQF